MNNTGNFNGAPKRQENAGNFNGAQVNSEHTGHFSRDPERQLIIKSL